MEQNIEDVANSDFQTACMALLIAKLIKQDPFTAETVLEAVNKARDELQNPDSMLRTLLARGVPDGSYTPYQSAVGAAHDRAMALVEVAMVL